MVKLPSKPTYAIASTVPEILAIVRPGRANWMLWTTKQAISTAMNVRNGQARRSSGRPGS